jgi:hypothetical protein
MTTSYWRRWLLFSVLVILGCGYIAAYVFFSAHSENFIVVQRNRRALAFAHVHPASLPATWTFGSGRAENASLGDGWLTTRGQPGAVMIENNAWVMLATTSTDTDLSLTLHTLFVTTPAAPRNRVEVSVNGQALGSWERGGADKDTPIEVRVPASLMKDGHCRLKIHVDRLASRYRPDAGPERNGQHVLLGAITLETAGAAATSAH